MFNFSEEDLLPYATAEDIYKYVNSYDMFRYYVGDFKLGTPILSPFDGEDKPSFAVYAKGTDVLFNDFRFGGGDIIQFVKMKFELDFRGAINKIVQDAGLKDKFRSDLNYVPKPLIKHAKVIKHNKPVIKVKGRNWASYDTEFWQTFSISKETLLKYRVSPISYIFINSKIVKADKLAYVFREFKDGKVSYTIYQPLSKTMKWIKSHDSSVFYGWSQLPETGDTLIITKSMKDVMTISSITELPAVALQNEKIKPKLHIIDQLKSRFTKIYLFYDNDYANEEKGRDNYGRKFGCVIADEFGLRQIEIPDLIAEMYDAKDPSDLAKHAGPSHVELMLLGDIDNYAVTSRNCAPLIRSHNEKQDDQR